MQIFPFKVGQELRNKGTLFWKKKSFLIQLHKIFFLYLKENYFGKLVKIILCVKWKPQRFLKSDASLSATVSQSKSEIPSPESVKKNLPGPVL